MDIESMKSYLLELKEDLEIFEGDRESQLEFLMELGKEIGDFPAEMKVEENEVPGCVSKVHVIASLDDSGNVQYQAHAEAFIIKGIVVILLKAINGLSPKDIVESTEDAIKDFATTTNVSASATASRTNSFMNIYNTMKKRAQGLL